MLASIAVLLVCLSLPAACLRQQQRQPQRSINEGSRYSVHGGTVGASAQEIWPQRAIWDEVFANVTSGAAEAPCSAKLLGRARLKPDGLGSRFNQFANELVLAMRLGVPIALCAPPGVRDTWGVYFQDPGFPQCDTCDYRGNLHPEDAWVRGFYMVHDEIDRTWVDDIKHFLYRRLFRFKSDVQGAADTNLQKLGLANHSFVGVHVRRGDTVTEAPLVPIQDYAEAVARLCGQVGAKKIFLASDDDSAYGQLRELLSPELELVERPRLPEDRYKLRGGPARLVHVSPAVVESEQSILLDVALLVRASAFVGTGSSGIGRLVYFLRDPATPAESLDDDGHFLFQSGL